MNGLPPNEAMHLTRRSVAAPWRGGVWRRRFHFGRCSPAAGLRSTACARCCVQSRSFCSWSAWLGGSKVAAVGGQIDALRRRCGFGAGRRASYGGRTAGVS